MPRNHKRVKFYHVPTSRAATQVHHASFTTGSDRTSVRTSFVTLSQAEPSTLNIDKEPAQDPVDFSPQNDGDFGEAHRNMPAVSLF
jgi:hypothetical protein